MPTPPGNSPLLRRYRRLLLAHPRWHRQAHGADMLTAMLDAAAHRGELTRREALTLVFDGLRCRFRVSGLGALVLATVLSLVGAGTLAAATSWIGWRVAAAPWPTEAQAYALAAPVLPAGTPDAVTRRDATIGPWKADSPIVLGLLGSPELRPGGVHFAYTRPHTISWDTAYATAARHLSETGWLVSVHHGQLVAERDDIRLTLLYAGRDATTDDIEIAVYPAPPSIAYRLPWLGAALGGVLVWLLTASAIARCRRRPSAVRAGITALAVAGAVASVPAMLLNVAALVVADADAQAAPPWLGYEFVLARPGAATGALALLAAMTLATRRWPTMATPRLRQSR